MAALQRFKLLATRCTAAPPPSPSRSPAPPHCFRLHRHHRRHCLKKKKPRTLRHLISSPDPDPYPIDHADLDCYRDEEGGGGEEEKKGLLMRNNGRTLRDLFVSSPKGRGGDGGGGGGRSVPSVVVVGGGGGGRSGGGGGGAWRFVGIRNRLLRRAWRPVLVAIPE